MINQSCLTFYNSFSWQNDVWWTMIAFGLTNTAFAREWFPTSSLKTLLKRWFVLFKFSYLFALITDYFIASILLFMQILLIGKSINFLRHLCGHSPNMRSFPEVQSAISVDGIFYFHLSDILNFEWLLKRVSSFINLFLNLRWKFERNC